MRKRCHFFAIAAIFILLSSCQQEPDEKLLPPDNSNRVKTYTESFTHGTDHITRTYNVTYDNNGRVTGLISTPDPGERIVYNYPSPTLYTMDIYHIGVPEIHQDYYLNASSLVDSTMQYNDTGDTLTEGYTYNADKQLTRLREYDYKKATGAVLFNTTNYTYAADGKLVKDEDANGITTTYDYYTDFVYAPPLTLGPITIAATKKMNLLKSVTISENGRVLGSYTITYAFDNKDRISTENGIVDDGSTFMRTYTYF